VINSSETLGISCSYFEVRPEYAGETVNVEESRV